MFSKILGKKKSEISEEDEFHEELVEKISKMNLTDMRAYVNNRTHEFEVSEDGLIEIMKRVTTEDKETMEYYLKSDDMDSKIKKGFDLVILICANKKISIEAVKLVEKFIDVYENLIKKYDVKYKEIYASRLTDSLTKAISNYAEIEEIKRKIKVIGD